MVQLKQDIQMLVGYAAKNKQGEKIEFFALTVETANRLGGSDASKWISDNLDPSCKWEYAPNGKFKFEN